jgi:protein-disulfide isomerase
MAAGGGRDHRAGRGETVSGLLAALIAAQIVAGGTPAPPVEVVVYSDFQCPFCRQFAQPSRELELNGVNGVPTRVTFKHFPLAFHTRAPLAHHAAEAARAQGRFWEMHDLLFLNQQRLSRADLIGHARSLALDLDRFEKDLDSEAVRLAVARDIAEARKAGVTATPSYSINGKMFTGSRSFPELAALVARQQRRARALAEIPDEMLALGPADAAVTIELFADLASPLTAPALAALHSVRSRYGSGIRVQFRNLPLPFHSSALPAHEASMAAARAGCFWEFATFIARQKAIDATTIAGAGTQCGLDAGELAATLREHRYLPRVEADRDEAASRGLRGSPVLIVNGKRFDGLLDERVLAASVDAALATAARRTTKRQ